MNKSEAEYKIEQLRAQYEALDNKFEKAKSRRLILTILVVSAVICLIGICCFGITGWNVILVPVGAIIAAVIYVFSAIIVLSPTLSESMVEVEILNKIKYEIATLEKSIQEKNDYM